MGPAYNLACRTAPGGGRATGACKAAPPQSLRRFAGLNREGHTGYGPRRRFRLTVTWKLTIALVVVLTAFNLYNYVIAIPAIQGRLEGQMRDGARGQVQTACGALECYYGLEASGLATRSQAQQQALTAISELNYGADGEGHFWVTDYRPVLLADASMPSRIGEDVGGLTDAAGRRMFADMARICQGGGEGFYSYQWGSGSASGATSRVAYVSSFQPWGWAVGTAVDVSSLSGMGAANKWTLGLTGGIVAVLVVLVYAGALRVVVVRSVVSTAGVAQENSAAAEQVSASVEQVSSQVGEVLAAAEMLAEAAGDLESSMAPFKI